MSQYVHGPTKSFPSGAALAKYRRVKLVSGVLQYAGASDVSIGILEKPTFADANYDSGYTDGTVRLVTAEGTRLSVAAGAITAGDPVYAAANGKVDASGTVVEGRALQAAGADGDVIEVLPIANTDISQTASGTNAATFQADADLGKPRAALGSQTGGTGDFKAVIRPPATLTADRIFTLEGDADATLVGKDTAQTLTNKSLTSPTLTGLSKLGHLLTPVAAAGSTVADAGQLGSHNIVHITSDGATKGVKLPTGVAGMIVFVINNSSTAAELYAASGGTVNGLSADASVVIPASKGVLCFCTAADTWIVFDMPAKATAS